MKEHDYHAHLIWDGNRGDGTSTYEGYGRDYRVAIEGKPDIEGSANAIFHGDRRRHDPEDLFVAAIASCHMLAYLSLCARHGIRVIAYEDRARGRLVLAGPGHSRFHEVVLRPAVTIAAGDADLAAELHAMAHRGCFIANSCSVPIRHEATIRVERAA